RGIRVHEFLSAADVDGNDARQLHDADARRRAVRRRDLSVHAGCSRSGQLKKGSFLSTFFILLGVAFAAAVWLRLRSLETPHDVVQTASAARAATAMEDGTTPGVTSSDAYELVPGAAAPPSGVRETSAQRTAREKRYEELLRSAPPS